MAIHPPSRERFAASPPSASCNATSAALASSEHTALKSVLGWLTSAANSARFARQFRNCTQCGTQLARPGVAALRSRLAARHLEFEPADGDACPAAPTLLPVHTRRRTQLERDAVSAQRGGSLLWDSGSGEGG